MRFTCSKCGENDVSVEVHTWCRFEGDHMRSFDDEDLESVALVVGGDAICHGCQYMAGYGEFK